MTQTDLPDQLMLIEVGTLLGMRSRIEPTERHERVQIKNERQRMMYKSKIRFSYSFSLKEQVFDPVDSTHMDQI